MLIVAVSLLILGKSHWVDKSVQKEYKFFNFEAMIVVDSPLLKMEIS